MLESTFLYAISFPIYLILLFIEKKRGEKLKTIMLHSLFYFYVVAVMGVTLFPLPIAQSVIEHGRRYNYLESNNFIPFKFIYDSIITLSYDLNAPFIPFWSSFAVVLRQVGGNILLTMPLGFLVPIIWKNRDTFIKTLIVGFWFSFGIEASQFLISLILGYTYRITDIDDIILNCTGCALGYLVYKSTF